MKIAKALKKKNKLVRELGVFLTKAQQNNSIIEGKERSYDPQLMINSANDKLNELVELKTEISLANQSVQNKIYKLSELKSFVGAIKGISTDEGPIESSWVRRDDKVVNYTVKINTLKKDQMIQDIENEIEQIQEELDVHNHTVDI